MLKLTVAIVYTSNDSPSVPSYLRQPTLRVFKDWDCEPRGVLGFLQGYIDALVMHLPNVSKSTLGLNGSVRLCFEEWDGEEIIDSLVLSMSLYEAPLIFACWVEVQSSKCLTWVSVEQVAEEFSQAKDALGGWIVKDKLDEYRIKSDPRDIPWDLLPFEFMNGNAQAKS